MLRSMPEPPARQAARDRIYLTSPSAVGTRVHLKPPTPGGTVHVTFARKRRLKDGDTMWSAEKKIKVPAAVSGDDRSLKYAMRDHEIAERKAKDKPPAKKIKLDD